MRAATYPRGPLSYPESKSHQAQVWIRPISPLSDPLHLAQPSACCASGWSTSAAWRHLLLLLYLSKPELPGNLGHIQAPPATTNKMLFHVNLICIPTLNLFQLSHPYVYQGRKAEQGKREGAECLFSNDCTSHFNFHFMLASPQHPQSVFKTFLLLPSPCFRSLLTLQTHPWKCFPFVKTSDLKQQQTAWHLLIHQHFCCCFINDSGWNSDLLGCLMAEQNHMGSE